MPKKVKLSIQTPCHENWGAMTPVERGRFCNACQKAVVDFTSMNDREIAQFFKKPSTGSVCGRLRADQLGRTFDIPKKRIPWFRYFFQVALPAFIFSTKASAQQKTTTPSEWKGADGNIKSSIAPKTDTLVLEEVVVLSTPKSPGFSTFETKPQVCSIYVPYNPIEWTTADISNFRDLSKSASCTIITPRRIIYGLVTDENGYPLSDMTVMIKGTKLGAPSDEEGRFRIVAKTGDLLFVSGVGFESKEVTVDKSSTISIKLKARNLREEVVITVGAISSDYPD